MSRSTNGSYAPKKPSMPAARVASRKPSTPPKKKA